MITNTRLLVNTNSHLVSDVTGTVSPSNNEMFVTLSKGQEEELFYILLNKMGPPVANTQVQTFEAELENLINKYGKENPSNTPDYVLAEYLNNCLTIFNAAVLAREAHKNGVGFHRRDCEEYA